MADENSSSGLSQLARLLAAIFNSSWVEMLAEGWKLFRKLWRGWTNEGIYEVLEHHSTLELLDRHGERAAVHKQQRVRFLQNNILAYQDQAWGDGEILINYRCTPGVAVDRYRPGQKTYILISLREVKNKGDVDEFNIQWEMHHGFTRPTELWAAEISHRTQWLKLDIIFPESRPPIRTLLVIGSTQRTTPLGQGALKQLLDGRYLVTWETQHPRLYETYAIQWEW